MRLARKIVCRFWHLLMSTRAEIIDHDGNARLVADIDRRFFALSQFLVAQLTRAI